MKAFIASFGLLGILFSIACGLATIYCWFEGVVYGFHHSFVLGLVSIIPLVGFVEGLLHLLGVI